MGMIEHLDELKETIIELRDNDGTLTQHEVCKYLATYMDVLEKQMTEYVPADRVIEIIDESISFWKETMEGEREGTVVVAELMRLKRQVKKLKGEKENKNDKEIL